MSENDSTRRRPLSRRSVLRKGTLLASVGAVGLSAFTGPAAATNDCPRSPGYWKTHWEAYLGDSVDILPAGTLTKAEIRSVLHARPAGDTVTIMAKEYVATYLNLVQRSDPDPRCAHKEVAIGGIGAADWEEVKNAAQQWLRLKGWDGSPHSGYRTWSPSVSVGNTDGTVDGEVLKDALNAFNNAAFDELDCNCDGTEERVYTAESDETCSDTEAGGEREETDCLDSDLDTSWYPPNSTVDLRPTEASGGPVRTRLGRGGIRNLLRRIR